MDCEKERSRTAVENYLLKFLYSIFSAAHASCRCVTLLPRWRLSLEPLERLEAHEPRSVLTTIHLTFATYAHLTDG